MMEAGTGSLTARGKGKAPGPPPPPPSRDEANGGHRRGQRRSIWPRGRGVVVALVAMIAAAEYLLFADALAVAPPSAEWLLAAYVLWIIGLNMLVWLMN
ncbi:hypothetical protein GQ55_4G050200 [Panicum hallii var. hallii]|uniref:Uncharacterized protein n=1 Tax=Panicum hallii var. hallii TaxID=1504633 RepID=A0A2T7DVD2_9POAL|nr:hypothetical protein GQ55_4G050200 [Panicum hallii var. hallii]